MARAIDADEFMKEIRKRLGNETDFRSLQEIIAGMPTIDTVKHGKWLCKWDSRMGTTEVTCSVCKSSREILGCYVGIHGEQLYDEDDFCPKCGADMRGDNDGKMAESD